MNWKNLKMVNVATVIAAGTLVAAGAGVCLADNPYCDDNGGNSPYVCVSKSGLDPEPQTDFVFDFSDADNPDVILKTGNPDWAVWSQVSEQDPTPANLGDITLDPSQSTDSFEVTIANGAYPGAVNVASIDLRAASWTGYSSIDGGHITGNLTGDLRLQQDSGGAGGDISGTFTVDDDVSGSIKVPVISGTLHINGNLSGNITVTDKIKGGLFQVGGNVTSAVNISIADLASDGPTNSRLEFNTNGDAGELQFGAHLLLETGLPWPHTVLIKGTLSTGASVDMNDHDVASDLCIGGAETGSSITAREAIGNALITIALPKVEPPWEPNNFSGTVTFRNVEVEISTETNAGNVDGWINVTGDMSQQIGIPPGWDGGGDLLAGGKISVGGNLSGGIAIIVDRDAAGEITVGGDVRVRKQIT